MVDLLLQCSECKPTRDAKGCGGHEWYDPGDLKFCTFQNMWLIEHEEELEAYIWPEAPSGYRPLCIPTSALQQAYFVLYETILADLHWRLERTETDGELLCSEIRQWCEIKQGFRLMDALSPKAKSALYYISGGRQNHKFEMRYSQWKAEVKAGRRREKVINL